MQVSSSNNKVNSLANILLIITDQHNSSVAGFAGDPVVQTECLDQLAVQSMQFQAASCASPVCSPSRMCLLTGKEAHHCSAWENHWVIFPEHVTWPQHFAENGYTTCLVGKMHFGGRDQLQGFQYRPYGDLRHGLGHQPEPLTMFPGYHHAESAGITEIPESLLQDVVVTRETLSFLSEHADRDPDRPWFVCASYGRPHGPLTAPGRYIRRYRDRVVADDLPQDWLQRLEPFARGLAEKLYARLTADEMRLAREAYYASVDFVDDCIGELLAGLKRQGLLENTYVIYTTDHGEMLGQHGLWQKGLYFEPSMAVPLLISGPGIGRWQQPLRDPVSLIDLFPTCCELTGLPVPSDLDGMSMAGFLRNPADTVFPRELAASEYFHYGRRVQQATHSKDVKQAAWRAVRSRDWKYVEVQEGSPMLFHLEKDPGETLNLVNQAEHQERCKALRTALFKDFSWQGVSEKLAADRRRLPEFLSGYKPTTPNQYMLPDGRVFDAEAELYAARWLAVPECSGGVIPQQFG